MSATPEHAPLTGWRRWGAYLALTVVFATLTSGDARYVVATHLLLAVPAALLLARLPAISRVLAPSGRDEPTRRS